MQDSRKQNYLKGASILAATVALTKIIGAIYKIPLYNLLGDEGTAHFQVTYSIYNLLLTISTAGVPVALSRLISEARVTNRTNQVKRYFSIGMLTFAIVGIIGCLAMFVFAQPMANIMGDPEVAGGVKALAPAVLFACIICVYRGYSQGHNDMLPTAISQIMEVGCKMVFGLSIAWYLSEAGYGSAAVAAGAIIGVTIGLGLAVPVLAAKARKISLSYAGGGSDVPASRWDTFKHIISISIPIMLGSSVINIITLIDTKLVLARLQNGAGFSYTDAKILLGAYSKGLTLFTLPSAFITPISVAVVPIIAAAIAKRRYGDARATVESALKLTNLIAMPAAVGLCVLSGPIYKVLYPQSSDVGPTLLAILGIASFFTCTYIITNGVLQASGHERLSLLALPIGGIIMIAVDWVLVGTKSINIVGSPIGTLACYGAITLINTILVCVKLPEKPNMLKITVRPAICTLIMGAFAWAAYGIVSRFLGGSRTGMIISLAVAVGGAVVLYFVLIILLRAVTKEDILLLPKGEKIAKMLKIK